MSLWIRHYQKDLRLIRHLYQRQVVTNSRHCIHKRAHGPRWNLHHHFLQHLLLLGLHLNPGILKYQKDLRRLLHLYQHLVETNSRHCIHILAQNLHRYQENLLPHGLHLNPWIRIHQYDPRLFYHQYQRLPDSSSRHCIHILAHDPHYCKLCQLLPPKSGHHFLQHLWPHGFHYETWIRNHQKDLRLPRHLYQRQVETNSRYCIHILSHDLRQCLYHHF